MNKENLLLYFIMGSNNTSQPPSQVLKKAINGGITCFQFREKGSGALKGKEKETLARELQSICCKHKIPFIVNDDTELAISLHADGIHVGQDDESIQELKKKCPSSMIIGVSAKTIEEAEEAERQGADYIGTGPMFMTTTKEDAELPIGPEGIWALRKQGIQLPIVGIGGINETNAVEVIEAGADGVSFISAISQADDPEKAASTLKDRLT
ncbi:thiamine phosphate synthase [Alteribacillus bidgolensis]|uniref:Thiamine-phosphate synthase n=1 Tax=Alteribacillus bidgolensis TaxID=930129 RepID=A0A1G8IMX8_9BACI|nr:thiamine phosphate synthase [Alteribacillus bidgolensis]SDI20398.1 thiamine-phosphate diphosphorylase [Alteribacillus bidgolensis]